MTDDRTGTPFDDTDTDREPDQPTHGERRRGQARVPSQSRWKFSSAVEAARYLGSAGAG